MALNPYALALGGRDAREVMAETPLQLAELVAEMPADAMEAVPAPGKWSLREVLAHLADCEIAFGFRLRQTYAGEALIQPFHQDKWARAYGVYTAELALHTFVALRGWNVAFVSGLREEDMGLKTNHPERGEMTLGTVVETIGGHDLHHLGLLGM